MSLPPDPIPRAVRDLIQQCLASMEHVELLLWLAADQTRQNNASQAAVVIHTTPEIAAKRLADLESAGLLIQEEGLFRYVPRNASLRDAVGELDTMYQQRPVTLVRAIYERPASPVNSFANAFRLRKED